MWGRGEEKRIRGKEEKREREGKRGKKGKREEERAGEGIKETYLQPSKFLFDIINTRHC